MPDWKQEVRRALASLDLDTGREESIAEELADGLAGKYDDLIRSGVDAREACRVVMEELGDEKLRANLRVSFRPAPEPIAPGSNSSRRWISGFGRDLRLALRQLRLNPAFAAVALLSLALGIGANTAIFSLIDAVVLRTLPVPNPQQLAEVHLIHGGRIGSTVARQKDFSSAQWELIERQQQGFSGLAAWSTEGFNLGHGGEVRNADGMWVSGGFFHVLELQPALGRLLAPSDDVKGCGLQSAVISYAFWQSEYGGRASAIGSTVSLDRHVFQIVGVTPQSFTGLEVGRKFDVAVPLCSEAAVHAGSAWSSDMTTWWLAAIGRLNPGWAIGRATSQLNSVGPGIFQATLPPTYDAVARRDYLRFDFAVQPAATGDSPLRKQYAAPLFVLLAISGLVLLIACANIAGLMLARASARRHEMALRMALGASRSRVARQLLVESLLLAAIGGAAGAALAAFLGRALIAGIATSDTQIYLSLAPDWRMPAFTAGVALLTCVVFGVAPALQAAATKPGAVIKTASRSATEGRKRFLVRRAFTVAQMALSLVLVVVALLFVRTFRNLVHRDTGFEQQGILIAGFDTSALNLPLSRRLAYSHDLLEQVRSIPGVTAAADASIVPLSGDGWNEFLDIPERGIKRELVYFAEVSSGYFQTLEVPMLAGRDFDSNDTVNSPPAAIVNEAFAKSFLGADAVGASFHQRHDGGKPDSVYRIVGVVGNTKYRDIREDGVPIVYVPESQDRNLGDGSTMLIRSSLPAAALIRALKSVAASRSSEIVLSFSVMRESILGGLRREGMMAALSGFYGALAALLATIGLYGIVSYSVVSRRVEIGIRMALGASRNRIFVMVLRDAFALLSIGLTAGVILVAATGRFLESLLFGLKAFDPFTITLALGGMIVVSVTASLLPARRAAAMQPMQTLREE